MRHLAIFLLALSSASHAADCASSDSRCKKATELVSLLGYSDSIKALQSSCFQASKAFHPDALMQRDQKLFGNIRQGSPKWSLLVQAFEQYKIEYCGDAIQPVLLASYRDAWASNLTFEELSSAINFIQSPGGRAFGKAFPAVYKAVSNSAAQVLDESGQAAYLRYAKRIREISE